MELIIDVAQLHDACCAALAGKHVEVEQHHLALQVGQTALLSLVVRQIDIDDVRHVDKTGIDVRQLSLLQDSNVLHALNGNVMQVLAALGIGIVGVPRRGDGSKHLHILFVGTRIEDERLHLSQAERLEQCIVSIGTHGLGEDVIAFHLFLVSCHHTLHAVANGFDTQVGSCHDGINLALEVHLVQCQFFDLGALVGTTHIVDGRHRGILRIHLDLLGGVYGEIDNLAGNAQPVELRSLRGLMTERERSALTELHTVDSHGAAQAHVLQIKHRVLCLGDGSANVERPPRA